MRNKARRHEGTKARRHGGTEARRGRKEEIIINIAAAEPRRRTSCLRAFVPTCLIFSFLFLPPVIHLTLNNLNRKSSSEAVTFKTWLPRRGSNERAKPPRGGADRAMRVGSRVWRRFKPPMRVKRKAPGPVCKWIEGVAEGILADFPMDCVCISGPVFEITYRSCSEFLSR
jgi:hypothetical protein